VQPAKYGSMAAVLVVLDRSARSLPLVREVRGDKRLTRGCLESVAKSAGVLARGKDACGTLMSCYTAGLAGWTGSYGR
jgi:hypothetical protein